ncbi:MAG TPA: hypothetical protein VK469_11205 [Candidatus Kapabacteria bacterium]|nr:hypothetical protein [Candidatus Kapabacteria bacterium]
MTPTKNYVLLEMREKKLSSGIILEGQSIQGKEFIIIDKGWDVDKEYKIGKKAHFGVGEVKTKEIDGKKYAIVEDFNIIGLE